MRYLTFFFLTKSLESSMDFTLTAALNSDQPHGARGPHIGQCSSSRFCGPRPSVFTRLPHVILFIFQEK